MTDETAPKLHLDPAKLRERAYMELADIAVHQGIINALDNLVDDRRRELFSAEDRVRMILKHLGCTVVPGAFDAEMAAQLLKDSAEGGPTP